MKLKVEVVSKEIIKPSSPTPDQLRHYQLSFLDQISPPVYNPLVLFYPMTKSNIQVKKTKVIDHLKQSMSDALTYYYPLAGRINDNLFVDCNDEGIPFVEAQVKCKLSDVLENPVPNELNKLVPFVLDNAEELPLGIQFNVFDCGGIGIGACISHKIADALSFFTFLNTWAAFSRGDHESSIVSPEFVSAKLFPPKSTLGYEPRVGISTERIVTKRFVFSASKIQEIRAKYAKSTACAGDQKGPSRIEALSAFLWSRFVASIKAKSIPDSCFYTIVHAVNLRTRIDPPLPEHSFGNFYRIAMTVPSINSGEDCCDLVNQMRESIRKIDTEYVKQLQDGQSHLDFIQERAERFIRGEMVSFSFTSLCRFPLYKADFGWGKPIWVGSPSLTFKNLVVFMDTVSGDGIEALINLKEEDMAIFGSDEVLLAYAVSQKDC
ncbi:hypothetical protein CRYUN_Cryun21dG0055400 [Craigia yunnanensis]